MVLIHVRPLGMTKISLKVIGCASSSVASQSTQT